MAMNVWRYLPLLFIGGVALWIVLAQRVMDKLHPRGAVGSAIQPRRPVLRVVEPPPVAQVQAPVKRPPNWQDSCSVRKCFVEATGKVCGTCRMEDAPEDDEVVVPQDYVPDVWKLRRWAIQGVDDSGEQWPPPLPQEFCEDLGDFGGQSDGNKKALQAMGLVADAALPPTDDDPKLLCIVYTTASRHTTSIRAQRETWGSQCDGFLVFSTEADPRIPAVKVEFEGPEEYDNIWQKVRSIWRFVHKHYGDKFDFFFIGGDDLFVVPQNLRNYLRTIGRPDDLHFHGRRFRIPNNILFNSGGAGYILSRASLKLLVDSLDDQRCFPHRKTATEDVQVALCLKNIAGLEPADTRDEQGRERFHPFAPHNHYAWRPSKDGKDWYERYNKEWGIKPGADCCAPDSVSFHYIKKPAMQRHLHALLNYCT
uniref:N-acetylgalactosaminide beta-1,3-galactosyltransferase n=1 Tax=Pinguiococcus pyrenoidosus TaxID=172671 RepID=A0A7R9U3Q6_9STRA|mmetsp:Transcript_12342/g.45693  ORF Transcript_12342/g.45693 Transcript_12342/m.45693 type:complete len:423 (+) Transcript_12342:114-1382(+)